MNSIPLLFLISDTGGGHRASARAVSEGLELLFPKVFSPVIIDPFAELGPAYMGKITNLYGPLTRHGSWVWGTLYHLTNTSWAVKTIQRTLIQPLEKTLARHIRGIQPAAIVSFHPLLNHITVHVRDAFNLPRIPFITVVTDLVDIHAAWLCKDADAITLASPGSLDRCRRFGIPANRCFPVGLPVSPSFTVRPPTSKERMVLRNSLGLPPNKFTVLLCGGADGSGKIARHAQAILNAFPNISLAIICGHNVSAFSTISRFCSQNHKSAVVKGFVHNMADWLRASDLVITKAGPGTIAEALCCHVPLLLTSFIPGQEYGNLEWVVTSGVGRYVPTIPSLLDAIDELSTPESIALDDMRIAISHTARPHATEKIAQLIASRAHLFVDR